MRIRDDLALVQVKAKEPLVAVRLGTSQDLMIGETAVAIGNPLGLEKFRDRRGC